MKVAAPEGGCINILSLMRSHFQNKKCIPSYWHLGCPFMPPMIALLLGNCCPLRNLSRGMAVSRNSWRRTSFVTMIFPADFCTQNFLGVKDLWCWSMIAGLSFTPSNNSWVKVICVFRYFGDILFCIIFYIILGILVAKCLLLN